MKERLRGDQSNGNSYAMIECSRIVGQNVPRASHTEIRPERFAVKVLRITRGRVALERTLHSTHELLNVMRCNIEIPCEVREDRQGHEPGV